MKFLTCGPAYDYFIFDPSALHTQFVETNFELGSNYTDVIAPQDVATYGGLCALASFDRADLKVHDFIIVSTVHCQ